MPDSILQWFKSFIPAPGNVDRFERMCACAGSLFGILLVGMLTQSDMIAALYEKNLAATRSDLRYVA